MMTRFSEEKFIIFCSEHRNLIARRERGESGVLPLNILTLTSSPTFSVMVQSFHQLILLCTCWEFFLSVSPESTLLCSCLIWWDRISVCLLLSWRSDIYLLAPFRPPKQTAHFQPHSRLSPPCKIPNAFNLRSLSWSHRTICNFLT